MFYLKHVYCLLLLLYSLKPTATTESDDSCMPSPSGRKEPRGALKLQQLIEKEEAVVKTRKETTENEWASGINEKLSLELMKTFNTADKDNPNCVRSYMKQNNYKDVCKEADLEARKTEDTLIAAFTNGRLGNQMSAFATIYALSNIFNLDMVILQNQFEHLKPYFPNVSEDLVVEKRYCDHCKFKWIKRPPKWFRLVMSRKAKIKKGVAITLTPYPNEPDIYKDYLPDLRQKFDLAEKYKAMARARIDEILADLNVNSGNDDDDDVVLIGVHFRGTDLAAIVKSNVQNAKFGSKYYGKAFKFYRDRFPDKKLVYLIVTDDPDLAETILQYDKASDDKTSFVLAGSQRDKSLSDVDALGLDLGLLTSLKHLVISYSTFGMWAGHLKKEEGLTVMSLGLEGFEEKVQNATFTGWHFFTDD